MAPLRAILDTNVLLSGIFFGGVPGRLLSAWQDDRLALVLSPAILAEYHEAGAVLATRHTAIAAPLDSIRSLLAQTATIVDAPTLADQVSADPAAASPRRRSRFGLARYRQVEAVGREYLR